MTTLADILTRHSSLLILDAASTVVQVGWLEQNRPARWARVAGEAGDAVFQGLRDLDINPTQAAAFEIGRAHV
jgi:hypothetical protein